MGEACRFGGAPRVQPSRSGGSSMTNPEAGPSAAIRPSFGGMACAPHQLIAMVFGLGLSRVWPGTLGTAAGFGLFLALQPLPPLSRALVYLMLVLLAAWAAGRTGSDLRLHDHNAIVVDETIGMSLVLEFVAPGWGMWAMAFLAFRLFDSWKPWPIRAIDLRMNSGFGVLLDDLLAALYAVVAIQLITGVAPFF